MRRGSDEFKPFFYAKFTQYTPIIFSCDNDSYTS